MTGRAVRTGLVTAAVTLLLAGCSSLPEAGPVETGSSGSQGETRAPFDFDPRGPEPGASREQVVSGFLAALQASPVDLDVPRQFLTQASAESWRPDRSTVVYSGLRQTPTGTGIRLSVDILTQLDAQGRWRTERAGRRQQVDLRLLQQGGEWRIADPPDALVVPSSHFQLRYQQYLLYFADPGERMLVPEPVYLPWGEQTPELLLAALLDGPPGGTDGVELSMLPRATRSTGDVPVSSAGLVSVSLTGQLLRLGGADRDLALAQLAATLRQVTGAEELAVTSGGQPALPSTGSATLDLTEPPEADPAGIDAPPTVFGVQGSSVVQVVDEAELAQASPLRLRRPSSIALDATAGQVAAVSRDRTRAVVAARLGGSSDPDGHEVYAGDELLRPAWDGERRLWLVDRTSAGARLVVVDRRGRTVRRLHAPGLAGRKVKAFTLSPDGSRLAAVVGGERAGAGDRLAVTRVVRNGRGRPLRLTPAVLLPGADAAGSRLVDLSWRSAATLAVLGRPAGGTSQVVVSSVDGSTLLDPGTRIAPLPERGSSLAASPRLGSPLVVGTRGGELFSLTSSGDWSLVPVPRGVHAPVFAG